MCRRGCPTLSFHGFVVVSVIVVVSPQSFDSAYDYDTRIHYILTFWFCFLKMIYSTLIQRGPANVLPHPPF